MAGFLQIGVLIAMAAVASNPPAMATEFVIASPRSSNPGFQMNAKGIRKPIARVGGTGRR